MIVIVTPSGTQIIPPSGGGGPITLAGDVTGPSDANEVSELQGHPLTLGGSLTTGEVLAPNGGGAIVNAPIDAVLAVDPVANLVALGIPDPTLAPDGQAVTTLAGAYVLTTPAPPLSAVPTTNLILDLDGDEGVTLVGSGVSAWTSQTVGAFVAAQGTAGARPIVVPWGYNDHDAVRFDGVDDYMLIPHDAALDLATLSVYVVGRVPEYDTTGSALPNGIIGRSINGVDADPFLEWSIRASAITQMTIRANGAPSTLGAASYDWRNPAIISLSVGAAGAAGRVQGRSAAYTGATAITYSSDQPISIGAFFYAAVTFPGAFDFARILIYSGQHTAAQAADVYAALSERYGLPVCAGRTTAA